MKNIDEIKKIAQNCLNCKNPMCVENCPVSNPIPQILSLIKKDKMEEARILLYENTNASPICSKLCDFNRQCYGNCVLKKQNKGIRFYEVEEFLAQSFFYNNHKKTSNNIKVAIIGAGISGISCAIDLSKRGYDVFLYEKNDQIGGVLYETIPSFRFNNNVLASYKMLLESLNVKILCNQEFGVDFFLEDLSNFKYIIMALGTTISKKTLENNAYILDGLNILKDARSHNLELSEKKILVIGGGNVAMDVARTLKRNNNEVHIIYRRDIASAPASEREIIETINEGIVFNECLAPSRCIYHEEKLIKLEVEVMKLIDNNHKRKSFERTGIFREIDCDYIVEAVGLDADYEYLKKILPDFFNEDGRIKKEGYLRIDNQIVFATGDYFSGASNFANATKLAKKTIKELEKQK